MMFLLMLLLNVFASEKVIKIAVIDTGFGSKGKHYNAPLCPTGHKDFTTDQIYYKNVPVDVSGHGTNVVGVIEKTIKTPHCFIIYKNYSSHQTGRQNTRSLISAIKQATKDNIPIINYSGSGPGFDLDEYDAIKRYTKTGGWFIAAAGNESENLDDEYNGWYPASYKIKHLIVVGNMDKSSNYGNRVDIWENGQDQVGFGIVMSGTSQATAIATAKFFNQKYNK